MGDVISDGPIKVVSVFIDAQRPVKTGWSMGFEEVRLSQTLETKLSRAPYTCVRDVGLNRRGVVPCP